ncbi:MAG: hypothetical protein KAT66_04185 [Candidatus Lokiarchaeota archaeon]|nr:hypothetical protein [Candidatus Lokiarchaeota archaeon]
MSSEILEPKDLRKSKLKKIIIIISAIALITMIATITVLSIFPNETADEGNGGPG